MENYRIQFTWVDMAGKHVEKRDFTNIEDAVERIYKMKRNASIKQLSYEMVASSDLVKKSSW